MIKIPFADICGIYGCEINCLGHFCTEVPYDEVEETPYISFEN